jgi:hypothetical protein
MPIKSPKQFRLMEMMAHAKEGMKGIGPSPKVAKDFLNKTSKKKKSLFAKAGK